MKKPLMPSHFSYLKSIPVGFVLACLLFLAGCQQETIESDISAKAIKDSNFVDISLATTVANAQAPRNNGRSNLRTTASLKSVKSTFSIKPDGLTPSMYIINYEDGGFAIISADNRINPVLAYSDENSFPTDAKAYPGGLTDWLHQMDDNIKDIRASNKKQSSDMKKLWDNHLKDNLSIDSKTTRTLGPDDCTYNGQMFTEIVTKNLNTATWNQWGAGYNNLITTICASNPGGRAPTGCVATAMAIVMKYHAYPASYVWSSMTNSAGSAETAKLMRDLGISSKLDNDYGCSGTSAQSNKIAPTFASMGYPTPSKADYVASTVSTDISNNKPVILCGGKESGWWIFQSYSNGHCWVADGYRLTKLWECRQNPWNPAQFEKYLSTEYVQFWMNWGWGGTSNGWYMNNNFNPGSDTFNYKPQMITNIRKP